MPNQFEKLAHPTNSAEVIPNDSTGLANGGLLFIGTGGDVKVVTSGGNEVTYKNLPDASWLPVLVSHVRATGTTATDLIVNY